MCQFASHVLTFRNLWVGMIVIVLFILLTTITFQDSLTLPIFDDDRMGIVED